MTDNGSPKPVGKILQDSPVAQAARRRIRERIIDAAVLPDSPNDPLSIFSTSTRCYVGSAYRFEIQVTIPGYGRGSMVAFD